MYTPKHYAEPDTAVLQALMRAQPLATLVMNREDGSFEANPIPLLLDAGAGPAGVLIGHVSRANPLWKLAGEGRPALAIFNGPQGYVSPNWMASKAADHKVVPTWDYEVVHAHGRLRAIDDPVALRAILERLTAEHEAGQPRPWRIEEGPTDYIAMLLRAIVAIEFTIERLEGKRKLNQADSAANRESIAAGLSAAGQPVLAERIATVAPYSPK